jgi:hypothetical protein
MPVSATVGMDVDTPIVQLVVMAMPRVQHLYTHVLVLGVGMWVSL